jgi:hypothetical protein
MSMQPTGSRGVITLAQGRDDRYLMLAAALLKSIRLNSPGLPVAVVTDRHDHPVTRRFDRVVPLDPDRGPPFRQKLHLASYAPYDETLYIDADSLVYGSLDVLWELFTESDGVGVLARETPTPNWCADVGRLPEEYRVERYLEFNGGVYYFRRGAAADAVMAEARDLYARSEELGLMTFGAEGADEPAVALALSRIGTRAIDDGGRGMRTPSALTGRATLDIAGRRAEFTKWGTRVTPVIVHFAGGRWHRRAYREQLLVLRLASRGLPRPMARWLGWLALGSLSSAARLGRMAMRRPPVDELAPD